MSTEILTGPGADAALTEAFRASLRRVAASVSIVAARDAAGQFHGMAVTSAGSLSMEPPSMMVAVNRSASVHPVMRDSGRFSLNLMDEGNAPLLEAFSRTELRDRRFAPGQWRAGPGGLPVLEGALACHVCTVAETHDFGTHTVFFGRVDAVILPDGPGGAPIVWCNGARLPAR
ncbi:flavin reductase family protein [Ruixingdingia sedimenti]|uniref:Flavin reductase family protein n=1 Tax=Ruixingdingia sedimenti TaxID=3073604 RepID=A0ABU1F9F5_9RHOB|nr:flavin reductase family protein [Xinfangfangia sp. LG-4]MDR5653506.1 flavin reductase family protein [Xinfangfangia sp. LG-4]